jgi:hypothetical protein
MVQSMAATSQPRVLSSLVSAFGNFTAAHGFAVNLVAVIALAAIGAAFCVSALRSDARLARVAVLVAAVFRLTPAGARQQTQVISVPVQLGSSS